MVIFYLPDSDKEVIVDLITDHEELCDKMHQKFKDMAKRECLWERFASSCKPSVKVRKT